MTDACRLQDQSPARQDQHVHQDPGARRRASVRHHRPPRRRRLRQAGNTVGRAALQPDTRQSPLRHRRGRRRQRFRFRFVESVADRDYFRSGYLRGASSGEVGRLGCRAKGVDGEANPAADADVHRDAVAWN